jgi:hypothetical protein
MPTRRPDTKKMAAVAVLVLWIALIRNELIDLTVALFVVIQSTTVILITGATVWGIIYLIGHPEKLKEAVRIPRDPR